MTTKPSQAARDAAIAYLQKVTPPKDSDMIRLLVRGVIGDWNNTIETFAQFERECYERAALAAVGVNLSGFNIGDAQNYIARVIRQLKEPRDE